MNRRTWLQRVLKAGGAGAALAVMNREGLLAMPGDIATVDGGDWHFDGQPESFLDRLNVMTALCLFKERVTLHRHAGEVLPSTSDPWCLLGAGFKMDLWARVFREKRRTATPDDAMVFAGQALCFAHHEIDPIASVDELARQFAERMIREGANTLARLPVPHGLKVAQSKGIYRILCAYDAFTDQEIMRVDTIVGKL